jgi:hypothetical protein
MNQHIINLALAMAANSLVHNTIEAQEVRKKVKWLSLSMQGKRYKDVIPFQIDTRLKSYAISSLGLIIFVAVFYLIFTLLNLSLVKSIWTVIILLTLAYISSAYLLDKYHVEIAVLTRPFLKKDK